MISISQATKMISSVPSRVLDISRRLRCYQGWVRSRKYSQSSDESFNDLRPYQIACLDSIQSALERGVRPAVSLPTGSGKTRIFSSLISKVQARYSEDAATRRNTLIVVNRKELLDQAIRHISTVNRNLKVKPIRGDSGYDKDFDVFVATYQTLIKAENLYSLDPNVFKLIVIDEAHHSAANSYLKILEYFEAIGPRELPSNSDEVSFGAHDTKPRSESVRLVPIRSDLSDRKIHVVGFSATMWRQDKKLLGDVFDEVCYHENVETMIEKKYLCPAFLQKIRLPKGYWVQNPDARGTPFTHQSGLELIFKAWKDNPQCASTIIFGSTIAQITDLANLFRENGVDTQIIHGKLKIAERERILAEFSAGSFPVLLNCQILTEGSDIPRIDQIIIARKLASTGLAMQIVGRGLRLFPGKTQLNVIVFPEFYSFEEGTFMPELEKLVYERLNKRTVSITDENAIIPEATMPEYSEVSSEKGKFSTLSLSPHQQVSIGFEESPLLWCFYRKKYYLFTLHEKRFTYFVINYLKKSDQWHFASISRWNKKFVSRKELFASQSLPDVAQYADRFMLNAHPGVAKLVARRSPWMMKPATGKQLETLGEVTTLLGGTSVTRGMAWQLLNFKSIGFQLTSDLIDTVLSLMEPEIKCNNDVLRSACNGAEDSSNYSSSKVVRSQR